MRFVKILVLGLLIILMVSCTSWMPQAKCPELTQPPKPRIDFYEYEDFYCLTKEDFTQLMEYIQRLEAKME